MKQTLEEALKSTDLPWLIPRMEYYANRLLEKKLWRGHRLGTGAKGQLLADGKSADDFVKDAFEALINGRRTYDEQLDLESNVKRTIESLIWNWKKKSDRKPLLDRKTTFEEDGTELDPIGLAADPTTTGISAVEMNELRENQNLLLADFKVSLEGDSELTELLEAYENGFTKPADIEELTGIPAKRVSELKRKIAMKLTQFAANHSTAEALEN
jgi:DNA-directed RNA polymerase specialized sigma24 family protein